MIDQETFEDLLPLAYQWAKTQEEFVLAHGMALQTQQLSDARLAGVRDCERIRVLVVDRIPLPEDARLVEATRRIRVLTEDTRCTGFGHAIIIRADAWGDRELLLHNLVHIAHNVIIGKHSAIIAHAMIGEASQRYSIGPAAISASGLAAVK